MSRTQLLAGALAVPALVLVATSVAAPSAAIGLGLTLAGLFVLRRAPAGVPPAVMDVALLLAFYSTVLWRDVATGASPEAALRFAAAAAVVGLAPGRALVLVPALVALSLGPPFAWPHGRILETLFASRDGLLFWNPVLWLGLLGLRGRGPVIALAAVVLAEGPHLAAAALPLLVVGLARTLGAVERLAQRRPGAVLAVLGFGLGVWNALLMAQYRTGRLPVDDTVSFARVAENGASILSESVGTPLAWPANWIFAARHGVSPAEFDRRAGARLFAGPGQRAALLEAGDPRTDPVFFSEGWTSARPCEDALCLGVMGTGRLFLPLERKEPLTLRFRLRGEGQALVAVNGVGVGGLRLPQRLEERRLGIGAERFERGLNELTLQAPAGSTVWLDWIACERDAR